MIAFLIAQLTIGGGCLFGGFFSLIEDDVVSSLGLFVATFVQHYFLFDVGIGSGTSYTIIIHPKVFEDFIDSSKNSGNDDSFNFIPKERYP